MKTFPSPWRTSPKRWSRIMYQGRVESGKAAPTQWKPGEMQELIERALQDGKVTKCQSADVSNKPVFGFDDSNFEGGKI